MKRTLFYLAVFFITSVCFPPAFAIESLDSFLGNIKTADTLESPKVYSYTANEKVIFYEDDEQMVVEGSVTSVKRYRFLGEDSVEVEIISEKKEGEIPDGDNSDNNERGDRNERFSVENLPFTKGSDGHYEYTDHGMVELDGRRFRKIEYRAKKRSKEYFDGTGWFDPENYLIYRVEFQYAKNPFGLKDFSGDMEFEYRDGYEFMKVFKMNARGGLLLLFNFNISVSQVIEDIEIGEEL